MYKERDLAKAHIVSLPLAIYYNLLYVFALWVEFTDGPLSSLGKHAVNIETKTNFTALSKHNSKGNRSEHE